MALPTFESFIAEKQLTDTGLESEFNKLVRYSRSPSYTKGCYAGNKILYHYQLAELCQARRHNKPSFHQTITTPELLLTLIDQTHKYGKNHHNPKIITGTRMYEMFRRLHGCISFFKPTIAINVYHKYNPTHILDPCAGWGGRLLGALAMGIAYTGIDTNINLKPGYDSLLRKFNADGHVNVNMIWENALHYDFASIDYDFVLTSPPYANLELYSGMSPFESEEAFYKGFLIPLITKCRTYIRRGGRVVFNISTKMYKALLKYGYDKCIDEIPMLHRSVANVDKGEKSYVW